VEEKSIRQRERQKGRCRESDEVKNERKGRSKRAYVGLE
jgi:hypothetical protein